MGIYVRRPEGKKIGTWWGRYRNERKSLRIATHPDARTRRKLAQDAFRQWTLEVDEDHKFPGRRDERKHTVKDLLERWMNDHGSTLDSATELGYYKATLLDHFGADTKLVQITSDSIERYKQTRLQSVGPAAINRELALLRAAFNFAIKKWDWYSQLNPVEKAGLLDEGEGRVRWLSNTHAGDEYDRLQAIAPAWYWDICQFVIETGLRREELTLVTWDDVDKEKRILYIPDGKSGEPDSVPLTLKAVAILERRIPSKITKAVFCNKRHRPYKPDYLTRQMKALTESAKIEDFRFHDLRHTAATYLIRNGVDIYTVQRFMRHESIEMTKRYAHHNTESVRKNIEAGTKSSQLAG